MNIGQLLDRYIQENAGDKEIVYGAKLLENLMRRKGLSLDKVLSLYSNGQLNALVHDFPVIELMRLSLKKYEDLADKFCILMNYSYFRGEERIFDFTREDGVLDFIGRHSKTLYGTIRELYYSRNHMAIERIIFHMRTISVKGELTEDYPDLMFSVFKQAGFNETQTRTILEEIALYEVRQLLEGFDWYLKNNNRMYAFKSTVKGWFDRD